MASELALQAYIFLGNALNTVLNGVRVAFEAEFGVARMEVEALYAKVEPLTPTTILEGVAGLAPCERALLLRVGQWCAEERLGTEFEGLMGVSAEEAGRVLAAVSAVDAG
jgi:hypothetical protein